MPRLPESLFASLRRFESVVKRPVFSFVDELFGVEELVFDTELNELL